MNRNINNSQDNAASANVEQLLRDAAYVLKLTRRVKEEMLRDVGTGNRRGLAGTGSADRPQFGSAV